MNDTTLPLEVVPLDLMGPTPRVLHYEYAWQLLYDEARYIARHRAFAIHDANVRSQKVESIHAKRWNSAGALQKIHKEKAPEKLRALMVEIHKDFPDMHPRLLDELMAHKTIVVYMKRANV